MNSETKQLCLLAVSEVCYSLIYDQLQAFPSWEP